MDNTQTPADLFSEQDFINLGLSEADLAAFADNNNEFTVSEFTVREIILYLVVFFKYFILDYFILELRVS